MIKLPSTSQCASRIEAEADFYSPTIRNPDELASGFRDMFRCEAALSATGGVYFLMSVEPIRRVKGESTVLYIGRTTGSLADRYKDPVSLSRGVNEKFYRHIVNSYGGIWWAFVTSDDPAQSERDYFAAYVELHLENPPKSRRAG